MRYFDKPRRSAGWELVEIGKSPFAGRTDGLSAIFRYVTRVDDVEIPSTVVTPSMVAFNLQELLEIKEKRLFILAVPERLVDEAIEAFRPRLIEQAASAPAVKIA